MTEHIAARIGAAAIEAMLYEVAATAMQKDRDRRYQSTRLLQSAWRRAVLSTPLY